MAIVQVKPIKRDRWHGKSGKESFSRPVKIDASVDPSTGKYAVKLTDEELEKLATQTKYDLSLEFIAGVIHPFWGTQLGRVKLEHGTNIFNTTQPLDMIRVGVLKASPLVANSQEELENGLYPDALFVIFDEAEEIEVKAKKSALRRKALGLINTLSANKKNEIVQIVLGISTKGQSNDYVDLKFEEAIEKAGPEKVIGIAEREAKVNNIHSLVLEAIAKNILRKEGSSVYYMTDHLGHDVDSTVRYFLDPNNQGLKAIILEKLK